MTDDGTAGDGQPDAGGDHPRRPPADADESPPADADGGPPTDDGPAGPPDERSGRERSGGDRSDRRESSEGRAPAAWERRPSADDEPARPAPEPGATGGPEQPSGLREWVHWFRTVDSGPVMLARELLSSVMFVAAVGLLLFAVSGVWPPMVAVQSGSMEPHMHKGDLVFIVEEHRFAAGAAVEGTGVVPYVEGTDAGYEKFGAAGDVVVYQPGGSSLEDPIIHRTRFWVEDGERWFDRADTDHVAADSCAEVANCPAPNAGFITKGDDNEYYDQAQRMSPPVKPEWIQGKAMVRIPLLGWIRLQFAKLFAGVAPPTAAGLSLALFVGSRATNP